VIKGVYVSYWKNGRTETISCGMCGKKVVTRCSTQKYCEECRNPEKRGGCEICGGGKSLILHHIVSLINGGTDESANLTTLCHHCHVAVHIIRVNQRYDITDSGWALFRKLVENCKTGIPSNYYYKYIDW